MEDQREESWTQVGTGNVPSVRFCVGLDTVGLPSQNPTSILEEEWKTVPGVHSDYEISNLGRLRSWKVRGRNPKSGGRQRLLVPRILVASANTNGYPHCKVAGDVDGRPRTMTLYRMVMLAFVGPRPDGQEVLHINEDKMDSRLCNLKYGTHQENAIMCSRKAACMTVEDVAEARKLAAGGATLRDICDHLSQRYKHATVSSAIRGRTWAYVPGVVSTIRRSSRRTAKLTDTIVNEARQSWIDGEYTQADILRWMCKKCHVTTMTAWKALHGRTWKEISYGDDTVAQGRSTSSGIEL